MLTGCGEVGFVKLWWAYSEVTTRQHRCRSTQSISPPSTAWIYPEPDLSAYVPRVQLQGKNGCPGREPRLCIRHRLVIRAGPVHLRRSALYTHVLRCPLPGGRGTAKLLPMHDARFIAPSRELRHDCAVATAHHVGAHGLPVPPDGHRPEGETAIRTNGSAQEAGRTSGLLQRRMSRQSERGDAQHAADSRSRNTDYEHDVTS